MQLVIRLEKILSVRQPRLRPCFQTNHSPSVYRRHRQKLAARQESSELITKPSDCIELISFPARSLFVPESVPTAQHDDFRQGPVHIVAPKVKSGTVREHHNAIDYDQLPQIDEALRGYLFGGRDLCTVRQRFAIQIHHLFMGAEVISVELLNNCSGVRAPSAEIRNSHISASRCDGPARLFWTVLPAGIPATRVPGGPAGKTQ